MPFPSVVVGRDSSNNKQASGRKSHGQLALDPHFLFRNSWQSLNQIFKNSFLIDPSIKSNRGNQLGPRKTRSSPPQTKARARTKLRALQAPDSSFQNGLEVDEVYHDDSVTGNPQSPGLGTSNTDPRTQRFVQREESKAVQSGGDDTAGGSDDEESFVSGVSLKVPGDESQASEDDIYHEKETGWSRTKREAMLYGAPDDQEGALRWAKRLDSDRSVWSD
ncbi:hypothetical protein C8R43DRAFT_942773 [Mycena crocata]|nr:hypothetical protein C8R43DRAFT_942773 [Mycena crocata]